MENWGRKEKADRSKKRKGKQEEWIGMGGVEKRGRREKVDRSEERKQVENRNGMGRMQK